MNSVASSSAGDRPAHHRRPSGDQGPPAPAVQRDVLAELSDHLIDRMFAIGLRVHNELIRSRRDSAAPAQRDAAIVTIGDAVDELESLSRHLRASIDRLEYDSPRP
ncbi:hypothetical protein [Nocardia blacklockiae]|uniref:hypothetical protein n=1 Tax=Nocardia blacklockiae TaxID=480036 RepID=UPI001894AAE7|nr:hypothetical protein [Nocardia blacklockiae]MBF6169933.1 hypothetical protein [Nocardia blacklockiae]